MIDKLIEINLDKSVAIDFEYKDKGARYSLICCSMAFPDGSKESYWLTDGDYSRLNARLGQFRDDGYIFIAHAVEKAEGRCFCELGLDPSKFRWFDTYISEWLLHNDNLDLPRNLAPSFGLADTLLRHRLVREEEEQELKLFKHECRADLIYDSFEDLDKNRDKYIGYCESDVHLLIELAREQYDSYNHMAGNAYKMYSKDHFVMKCHPLEYFGHIAAIYSKIAMRGIPINSEIMDNVQKYAKDLKILAMSQFPYDIHNVKKGVWTTSQQKVQDLLTDELIKNGKLDSWPRTDKGLLSTRGKQLDKYKDMDNYPFVNALRSYGEVMNMYKGIVKKPEITKEKFLKSLIPKEYKYWLRTYDGKFTHPSHRCIVGTQTGRCGAQPSEGFLPLWSRGMRTLIQPSDDSRYVYLDFGSQEVAVLAAWANDDNLRDAYLSPDYYWHTGKVMKIVPEDWALDKSNPEMSKLRGAVKTMCLGIQYGMGARSLQDRVPEDLHLDAREILSNFEKGFPEVAAKKRRYKHIVESLHSDDSATFIFPDGFIYTVKDPGMHRTKSILSTMNMPIQGAGSCILRRIVDKLNETGIELAATIHDEIFFKIRDDSDIVKAADVMKESFWEITDKDYIKIGDPEIVDRDHPVYHGDKAKAEFEKLKSNIKKAMKSSEENISSAEG